jgi:hypothetical protein
LAVADVGETILKAADEVMTGSAVLAGFAICVLDRNTHVPAGAPDVAGVNKAAPAPLSGRPAVVVMTAPPEPSLDQDPPAVVVKLEPFAYASKLFE